MGRRVELERRGSHSQGAGYEVRSIANPLQDLTIDSEYVADYLKTIHGPRLVFPATVRRPGDVTA